MNIIQNNLNMDTNQDKLDKGINEFTKIIRKYNLDKNIECAVDSIKALFTDTDIILHIMINFDNIDENMNDVEIEYKTEIYSIFFNGNTYEKVFQSVMNCTDPNYDVREDEFSIHFFNSAILVELVKYSLLYHQYNKLYYDDFTANNIMKIHDMNILFDKIRTCEAVIQKLYEWTKTYFYDINILNINELFDQYNIKFISF